MTRNVYSYVSRSQLLKMEPQNDGHAKRNLFGYSISFNSITSKILIAVALLLCTQISVAQRKPKPLKSSFESFLDTQWWLGLRFGLNYTQPDPVTRFSALSPINYDEANLEKTYENFSQSGGQAGLDVTFYHRGISIGLQPTFKIMRYTYFSDLAWAGDETVDDFETRYDINQKISVIEVPLIFKYDLIQRGKIRPFLLAGLQHSFLIAAEKETTIMHTDYASGAPREYSGGKVNLGVKDQFKNFSGALGGAGVSLDAGNIRTILEATYLYALTPVTEKNNLYQENELVSLGEVNDEIKLRNINVSLSFVFPLRYIDKTFQPY